MLSRISDWIEAKPQHRFKIALIGVGVSCAGIGLLVGLQLSGFLAFLIYVALLTLHIGVHFVDNRSTKRMLDRYEQDMEIFDAEFEMKLAEFRREMGVSEARLQ